MLKGLKKAPTRETYHHEDLKSELIKKGLKILDKEGYKGFTLRKVARACGVSQTAPYRHFKNKDELILAIALEDSRKFDESLRAAVDQYPGDPEKQLKEMGCAYVEFFVKNPEYLRLIFLSDIGQRLHFVENASHDCMAEFKSAGTLFDTFYNTVEHYKNTRLASGAGSMSMEELLLYCWGLVHGIAILISRKDFPHEGDYMALVRKILWNENFIS